MFENPHEISAEEKKGFFVKDNMGLEIVISVTLLLVGIAVLVIIHVCIVSRAFRRNSSNNNMAAVVVQRNRRTPSLSQDEIKNLPSFDYCIRVDDQEKESSSSSSNTLECAVCLENFKEGEKCRILPKCDHCFHAECIDSWLVKTGACPICRTGAAISPKIEGENSNDQIEVGLELT